MKPMRWILAALAALLLGALSSPAAAQAVGAKTVVTCGTPGNTPVVGNVYSITQDTTGVLCTSGSGGGTSGGALETTQLNVLGEITGMRSDLATPALTLPPTAPAPKGDTTYTRDFKNISSATDTALITATASQTGRLHRLFCTIDAADTLILKDGSSAVSGTFRFPSTGGILDWPLDAYAYVETTANTALNLTTSTTANVNCSYRYKKD